MHQSLVISLKYRTAVEFASFQNGGVFDKLDVSFYKRIFVQLATMTKPKVKQKKADKSKESPASSTGTEPRSSHTPPAASPDVGLHQLGVNHHGKTSTLKVTFAAEIQSMMYALGDCRRPLLESAEIVEDIVHRQMTSLLQRAADVCNMRNARFISIEDFIFLMRNDRNKLRRLIRFLNNKDQRQKLAKVMGTTGDDDEPGEIDQRAFCRRRKISYDFLSALDQTGELISLIDNDEIDPVRMEKLERAELKTKYMDSTTYKEYTEARQVSFAKKGSKFKEWLDYSTLEPKPNPFALEILQYLAYEAVAQIMELAFLSRRDMQASPWDPLTKTSASLCSNNLPSPGLFLNKSTKPSPASTPLQSPTSSPTSPNSKMVSPFLSSSAGGAALNASMNSSSSDSSFHAQGDSKAGGHSVSKSKSKRKKKPSGSSLLALVQYRAIRPMHIREAYRRFHESSTPMATFCKYASQPEKTKYLVC